MQIKQDGGCKPHAVAGIGQLFLPTDPSFEGKMTRTKHLYETRHSVCLFFETVCSLNFLTTAKNHK